MPNPSYHPSIVTTLSTYHFSKVDIHGLQLDFEAVGIDGTVIDAFTLYHVDDTTAADVDLNKSTYVAIVDCAQGDIHHLSCDRPLARPWFLEKTFVE